MRPVRREATGWRDQALSARHRDWGADLAAVDLDLTLLEYDRARPVCLIEFKAFGAEVDLRSPSLKALECLATAAGIPFAVVKYQSDIWCFHVTPINEPARRSFRGGWHTELDLVTKLYGLRGRPVPVEIADILRTELPPVEMETMHAPPPSPVDCDGEIW